MYLWLIWGFAIAAIVFGSWILQSYRTALQWKRDLEPLQRKIKIRWTPALQPLIEIEHGEVKARVHIKPGSSPPMIIVELPGFEDEDSWTISTSHEPLSVAHRIPLPKFGILRMWTDSEGLLTQFEKSSVPWLLASLVGELGCRSCTISSTFMSWVLQGEWDGIESNGKHILLRQVLSTYDQFRSMSRQDIQFLPSTTFEINPDFEHTCKLCGQKITSEIVRCSKCHTPYHSDCWEFVGRCSVFGCD